MRIVIDTNIVFSAILNTQGKLSRIILQPKSRLNLYTTSFLYQELSKHKAKLISISKYSEIEFQRAFDLITQKIKIINFDLIPKKYYEIAYKLTSDIDENDIEFAKRLVLEHGVATIPLSVFNANGKDRKMLRFCFAKDDLTIEQATEKLCKI